jgi:hypothetical protein
MKFIYAAVLALACFAFSQNAGAQNINPANCYPGNGKPPG